MEIEYGLVKKYTTCEELLSDTKAYNERLTTAVIKLALKHKFNVKILYPGEDACVRGASVAIVAPKFSSTFKVEAVDGKIYVPTYSISASGDTIEDFINAILACLEEELVRHANTANSLDFKDYVVTKELYVKQIAGPYKDEKVTSIPLFGWILVGICLSH